MEAAHTNDALAVSLSGKLKFLDMGGVRTNDCCYQGCAGESERVAKAEKASQHLSAALEGGGGETAGGVGLITSTRFFRATHSVSPGWQGTTWAAFAAVEMMFEYMSSSETSGLPGRFASQQPSSRMQRATRQSLIFALPAVVRSIQCFLISDLNFEETGC